MTINERVKEIRSALDMSMESFGSRIGVTRSAISRIESGIVSVTAQVQTSIIREFNVNEKWLLTGEGSMFNELSDDELVARYVGRMFAGGDPFVINTLKALGKLGPEQWEVLKELIDTIKGE